jgi:dTDP-glucose 4,6-dehydratase
MSTLLVIGGSGFFGKSILDAYWRGLLSPWKISKIIVLARNAKQTLVNYPELICPTKFSHFAYLTGEKRMEVELIDADIAFCTKLPYADFVIHAAASTDARKYVQSPQIEKDNIHMGTINFCNLANQFLKGSRIIYVSSGAVYGQHAENGLGLTEDTYLAPIESLAPNKQDYAAAKRDAEQIMRNFADRGNYVSIARCFAFLGSHLPRDQHFAIGNFIENGLRGESVLVKADRLVFRSYLFADDLVVQLMTIASQPNTRCSVYNVGSDQPIEIRDLGRLISSYFDVELNIMNKLNISSYQADYYVPNIQKYKNCFGIKSMALEHALDLTVKSIRSHNIKTNH